MLVLLAPASGGAESQNCQVWEGPLAIIQPNPRPRQGHLEQTTQNSSEWVLNVSSRSCSGSEHPDPQHHPSSRLELRRAAKDKTLGSHCLGRSASRAPGAQGRLATACRGLIRPGAASRPLSCSPLRALGPGDRPLPLPGHPAAPPSRPRQAQPENLGDRCAPTLE